MAVNDALCKSGAYLSGQVASQGVQGKLHSFYAYPKADARSQINDQSAKFSRTIGGATLFCTAGFRKHVRQSCDACGAEKSAFKWTTGNIKTLFDEAAGLFKHKMKH